MRSDGKMMENHGISWENDGKSWNMMDDLKGDIKENIASLRLVTVSCKSS